MDHKIGFDIEGRTFEFVSYFLRPPPTAGITSAAQAWQTVCPGCLLLMTSSTCKSESTGDIEFLGVEEHM